MNLLLFQKKRLSKGISLALDFTSGVLDSRITFTRASSGTRVNSSGVIESVASNLPRFDYDPATLAPKGLLIEEQRTNLALNSNTFKASVGTSENLNATTSPDGTQNASLITETTINGEHYSLDRNIAITLDNTYVWSFYTKQGNGNARKAYCRVSTAASASVIFDLTTGNGAIISSTNLVTYGSQQLPNGWLKCYIVFTAGSTGNAVCRAQLIRASDNTSIYTGDGVSGLYFWGAQLEAGAFPTSYIPTTSATVTRAADNASMVGSNFSSWYNQSEGTIYSQWILGGDNTSVTVYNINDTTSANYIRNRYNSAGSGNDNAVTVSSIVQQTLTATNQIALYARYKNAMSYKQNDFARSANGTLITGSTGNIPVVSQMNIGASESNVNQINGHIQSIKYYPTRLPNADLQRLTR